MQQTLYTRLCHPQFSVLLLFSPNWFHPPRLKSLPPTDLSLSFSRELFEERDHWSLWLLNPVTINNTTKENINHPKAPIMFHLQQAMILIQGQDILQLWVILLQWTIHHHHQGNIQVIHRQVIIPMHKHHLQQPIITQQYINNKDMKGHQVSHDASLQQ